MRSFRSIVISIFIFFVSLNVFSESLTILHTSDLHSHFSSRDTQDGLGGLAKLKTKIDEIRHSKENTLLLDSGDFSEGSIFFALDNGETTLRLLDTFGYDALVLGNHDWLVGPSQLFASLNKSDFKSLIVSGNLNFNELDSEVNLHNYIKPFFIKQVGQVKVGVIGLSTYQLVFDSFFKPVKISNPFTSANYFAKYLREQEGCDVVIVLSHLGIETDMVLASTTIGIDLILGGHSHVVREVPLVVNGVPIFHIGKWGERLGQIDLNISPKGIIVKNFKIHPIVSTISDDPEVNAVVDGSFKKIEDKWGPGLFNTLVQSEVELPKSIKDESSLGNWTVDAIRNVAQSDIGIDNPTYSTRGLLKGNSSGYDFFNIFPFIYSSEQHKTWTIKRFEIRGFFLKYLTSLFLRTGLNLKFSNVEIILDKSKKLNQIFSFKVGGSEIRNLQVYSVGASEGVISVFDFLRDYGIPIDLGEIYDSQIEVWQAVSSYLQSMGPITKDRIVWEGRVRTLQPDLMLRGEEVFTEKLPDGTLKLEVLVRNSGLKVSSPSLLKLTARTHEIQDQEVIVPSLKPGQVFTFTKILSNSEVLIAPFWVGLSVDPSKNELNLNNNMLDTYIKVP